ncbi:MAG: tetratricopeptide repeat protein [Acidobacteriota bacterium]
MGQEHNAKVDVLLDDVQVIIVDEQAQVEVSLSLNGRTEQGHKEGVNRDEEIIKLIALATLQALNRLLPRPLDLKLDYIKVASTRTDEMPFIHTLIRQREIGKDKFLQGRVALVGSPYKAAAQAILQALTETIEQALARQYINSRSNGLKNEVEEINTLSNLPITGQQPPVSSEEILLNAKRAQHLAGQGRRAAMQGNYQQAVYYYQQASELEPDNASYHHQLGLALAKLPNNGRTAERAFLQAIELNPQEAAYRRDLGILYKELGLVEKAVAKLKEALELDNADTYIKRELQTLRKETSLPSLAAIPAPLSFPTNLQDWRTLLALEMNTRMLYICIATLVILTGLVLAGFYVSNLPSLHMVSLSLEKSRHFQALDLLQNLPSSISGLSIKERTEIFVKEERITQYRWWSGRQQGKDNNKFVVMFIFNKGDKQESAIWLVNLSEKTVKANNPLAETFSGR